MFYGVCFARGIGFVYWGSQPIAALSKFDSDFVPFPGYSGEQAYLLLSSAPVRGSIAEVVDIPNACTTLGIPMDIFDFDISVEAEPLRRDFGAACAVSKKLARGA